MQEIVIKGEKHIIISAVDLQEYVDEHIFIYLLNQYDLKITFKEWLESKKK